MSHVKQCHKALDTLNSTTPGPQKSPTLCRLPLQKGWMEPSCSSGTSRIGSRSQHGVASWASLERTVSQSGRQAVLCASPIHQHSSSWAALVEAQVSLVQHCQHLLLLQLAPELVQGSLMCHKASQHLLCSRNRLCVVCQLGEHAGQVPGLLPPVPNSGCAAACCLAVAVVARRCMSKVCGGRRGAACGAAARLWLLLSCRNNSVDRHWLGLLLWFRGSGCSCSWCGCRTLQWLLLLACCC